MAVFLLIRHGHNDSIGKAIVGRSAGICLNRQGSDQAQGLIERFSGLPIDAIFSSPLERCRETAAPLARERKLEVQVRPGLHEIEFGEWTGETFGHLAQVPRWRLFNTFRSGTRIPGGELMAEVQARMVAEIEGLRQEFPEGTLALFSHGDPIKAAIAHYAGFPLDMMLRYEISLASVSILAIHDTGPRILCINHTGSRLPMSY
ncbi:MAG: histidine phosphatase family protein [Desulfuromonadales bacterium]|jgi:probable phosphoglycerate mutase